ncbi:MULTISPECIES: TetR/AcrR family transcriptional regulator [Acinetobacter]|uniref:TetR/AcrR family transcriptional regulator n=1 Tax=Acinetobacter corruptisaponis TaxID=3045147 RepID=A0ABY8S635_9GAMM|nr:TetR/AcrR family transcriptional regulator [Acinetobacter sp. KCTC 92772]WHP05962.1 TetR/AcrR family transcriptional regulator [Acinetobacter sp. KCTC 92772]
MARPRSNDKRDAILNAAVEVLAEMGERAPTSKIAKLAGVAEGTLFTYFNSKEELLNQLYLSLKAELRHVMMLGYPTDTDLKAQMHHVWQSYLNWGISAPQKRKVMAQLSTSEQITEQSKQIGMQSFCDLTQSIQNQVDKGCLRDYPPLFIGSIFGAMAEVSINFMVQDPMSAESYRESGFEAFWHAVAIM